MKNGKPVALIWRGGCDYEDILFRDGRYMIICQDGEKEYPKKMLQWLLTDPWDKTYTVHTETEDGYITDYVSDVYDCISLKIRGEGITQAEATQECITNLLEIMGGYSAENLELALDACADS